MRYAYRRSYRGPVQLAIFDWAGTVIDFGCCAPAGAFAALFARHGVAATQEQARGPMGMHKRDHIAAMIAMPEIARQWEAQHGRPSTPGDIEALFQEFIPMQLEALPGFTGLIPGVPELAAALRARGIKLGGTTGYNSAMMNICAEAAAKQGYAVDYSVAGDCVPAGRPAPWMAVSVAMQLGVYPFEACVKIGDTVTDVEEGLNAGMWSVAVVCNGNEVGLSEAEYHACPPAGRARRVEAARAKLTMAGAHYVIDETRELPAVIDDIEARLARGERP